MSFDTSIPLVVFLAVSTALLLVFTLAGGRKNRLEERIDELSGRAVEDDGDQSSMAHLALTTLPRVGSALVPSDDEERTLLKTRLIHAGMYNRQAMFVFLGVKLLL